MRIVTGLLAALITLVFCIPVTADPITMLDGFQIRPGVVGLRGDSVELRSSGGTGLATFKYANSINNNRTVTVPDPGAAASFVMTEGAQTINGAKTFGTAITGANINQSVRRQTIPLNFKGGDVLTDGATYVLSVPMTRAGTVRAINISAHTRMIGGVNTLALAKKNAATSVSLISTATVDPTAVPAAADVAENLTLTATGADLIFASGDCLKATLVCGTMTTDGQGYALSISIEYTDI